MMTTAELLRLPEADVNRWLVQGQLRERPRTLHDRRHARAMTTVSTLLEAWRLLHRKRGGLVLAGEVGLRLARDPDTTLGVDVVYVTDRGLARDWDDETLIEEIPILVVEILSPSDVFEDIKEKIDLYQKYRVPLIWVIDPHDRTVTIYRLDAEPELVNIRQELTGEPFLPGFRVPVAEIFA